MLRYRAQKGAEGMEGCGGPQRVVEKNQAFKLINNLLTNTVIGCGGELNQSECLDKGCRGAWRIEGYGGVLVYLWLPLPTTL